MKLIKLTQPIMEIWRTPTRILKRVNMAIGYSNNSLRYSPSNSIDPQAYFKKKETYTKKI